jgi:hypothetical protein
VLDITPTDVRADLLGAHNEAALKKPTGVSDAEIAALYDEGVPVRDAIPAVVARGVPPAATAHLRRRPGSPQTGSPQTGQPIARSSRRIC